MRPRARCPTKRRRPYGSSSGFWWRCGPSSNSWIAETAVEGRSWRPGQNRSVSHDMVVGASAPARMFSSTLTSSNSSSDWNERRNPLRARLAGDHLVIGLSPRLIRACAGFTKPVTASMIVVLPAPLGPMSPTTSPGCTSKLTSSTATTPPKRTVRSATVSAAGGTGSGASARSGASSRLARSDAVEGRSVAARASRTRRSRPGAPR